jgi:hypothetical protein
VGVTNSEGGLSNSEFGKGNSELRGGEGLTCWRGVLVLGGAEAPRQAAAYGWAALGRGCQETGILFQCAAVIHRPRAGATAR